MKFLIKLLESVFPFLFNAFKKAWDNLTEDQQQSLINSGMIGQYLKNNLNILGTDLVKLIVANVPGLTEESVTTTLISLAGVFGVTTTDVNQAVEALQNKLKSAASNAEWNGLLSIILNAGATVLSGGTLDWVHIAIGLGEWAYQKFIAPQSASIIKASPTVTASTVTTTTV